MRNIKKITIALLTIMLLIPCTMNNASAQESVSNRFIELIDGIFSNSLNYDVGGYTGRLADISTTATYSSNRRSLNCTGRFKIYAVSTVGSDPHYSKEFSITLKATI